jgi:DNA-binding transcriptional MerR regulator
MWTLDELVDRVRVALDADGYPGAPNRRVRDVPDRRAIRWYQTTGLVDRPAVMRGRVALYGRRHLLQLVAVKRRQAEGRSLAEIQAELTGATEATLAAVARVPEALLAEATATPTGADASDRGARGPEFAPARPRFWAAAPAERALAVPETPPAVAEAMPAVAETMPPVAEATPPVPDVPGSVDRPAVALDVVTAPAGLRAVDLDLQTAPAGLHTAGDLLTGIPLGGGAVLLVPGRPTAADIDAIAAAAHPLLDVLVDRHLTARHRRPGTTLIDDSEPVHARAPRTHRSSS